MRRLLKFLHTMGAIGLMGSLLSLLVLSAIAPPRTALAGYAATRAAMGAIATWMFLPSLGLCLISGLLSIAVTRAFHNAGWAWVKMLSGILLFEFGLQGVQSPMQDAVEQSAAALAGHADAATVAVSRGTEQAVLWVLLAVATANVVLGIWRPRFTQLRD